MRGLYKHRKRSVDLDGRQSGGQQFVKDENDVLLKNKKGTLQRWAGLCGTLPKPTSPIHHGDGDATTSDRSQSSTGNDIKTRGVCAGNEAAAELEGTRLCLRSCRVTEDRWRLSHPSMPLSLTFRTAEKSHKNGRMQLFKNVFDPTATISGESHNYRM